MAKFKFSLRIWILIIVLLLSVLAIKPNPFAKGVQIKSIEASLATEQGIGTGQILLSINDREVKTLEDFAGIQKQFELLPKEVTVSTDKDDIRYESRYGLGFTVDNNLTVLQAEPFTKLEAGDRILALNNKLIKDKSELDAEGEELFPRSVIKIKTNKAEAAFLGNKLPEIVVAETAKTNLRKGLDLEGGTRVLLKPVSDQPVTEQEINDIISVLDNRLNLYGLTDLRIRSSKDWQGTNFILIEIAGVGKQEVEKLIAQQGKFEARIGNETAFSGGKKDIPFVCRNDGSCSGIKGCAQSGTSWYCQFEFAIHLSPEAAKQHANITNQLNIVTSENGNQILSKSLELYLDDKLVDTLNIGADLKGSETTNIAISGPGTGATREAAIDGAMANMNQLQTVLITGSLPYDLEIAKIDSISPNLGESFIKNSLLVGLAVFIGVALVIVLRYKIIKITIPIMITLFSELLIMLGFAALIKWNLDLSAIAGIIAAIGTGVNDQIVIIDETIKGKERKVNTWKQSIKNAFFIIFAAYSATVAGMLPLWNAGAGLVRGFALTTIVGVTVGVLITRPAFASFVEMMFKQE
ncbi:hypothetical protein HY501_02140 [Candidatus Woesearchaeota archaeon]|nr:hypothetical protein [Candidatus Woesearchaeota archaeon]